MEILENYFSRPVPFSAEGSTALDYHQITFDLTHELAQESLVNISEYGLSHESFYARSDGGNVPYRQRLDGALESVWCRKSVAEKLQSIDKKIKIFGLQLHILDAYRPIACQQALWDFFMGIAKKDLANPSEENCRKFVGQYISDPTKFDESDFRSWPTHVTGGAVDLTIRHIASRDFLYMGGIFDDSSPISHTAYYEDNFLSGSLSHEEARNNRRLLYWLMVNEGFANYSYEWWHFDWGTQMWAMNRTALYPNEACVPWYGYTSLREVSDSTEQPQCF